MRFFKKNNANIDNTDLYLSKTKLTNNISFYYNNTYTQYNNIKYADKQYDNIQYDNVPNHYLQCHHTVKCHNIIQCHNNNIKCHKIQCKDGQYIEIRDRLYKLHYIEIKYNKLIYYFECDIILEIIEAKNNRIIYNIFNLSNTMFIPQTADFIHKNIIKKYNLLSTTDNIELDLIYKLLKQN